MSAEVGRRPGDVSEATSARPCGERASEGDVGAAIAMTFVSRCEPRELLAHPIGPLVRTCREGGALTDGERAAVDASGLLDVIEGRPCWACVHDERGRERWVRGVVAGGIRSRYCGRQVRQYEGHDVVQVNPWLETVAVHLDGESEARDVAVERVRAGLLV